MQNMDFVVTDLNGPDVSPVFGNCPQMYSFDFIINKWLNVINS